MVRLQLMESSIELTWKIYTKYADPNETFPAEDMLDAEAKLGDSYLIQGGYNWNEPSDPMGGMH